MRHLRIEKPGLLTTVQDLGRWGWQSFGVSVAGAMDPWSHRLANRLVGNPTTAATLEVTLIGPEVSFECDAAVAVAGAEFPLTLDDRPVACGTTLDVTAGARLCFGQPDRGARAYLAVDGGFAMPPVFGSRSTHLPSRMGGWEGRSLREGDRLPLGPAVLDRPARRWPSVVPLPEGGAVLRVIPGPHDDRFVPEALHVLTSARYVVTPQSNRMGYRLAGPPLRHAGEAGTISEPAAIGSLQVPAAGQPILLMADRQTAGGYAKIATVITADLGTAGQLRPGDWVAFRVCDRQEALRALIERERRLMA